MMTRHSRGRRHSKKVGGRRHSRIRRHSKKVGGRRHSRIRRHTKKVGGRRHSRRYLKRGGQSKMTALCLTPVEYSTPNVGAEPVSQQMNVAPPQQMNAMPQMNLPEMEAQQVAAQQVAAQQSQL